MITTGMSKKQNKTMRYMNLKAKNSYYEYPTIKIK